MKPLPATSVAALALGWVLSACVASSAATPAADAPPRFVWTTFRLRETGTVDNRLLQNRRIVMMKLDSATGQVWQYNPDSLTLDTEGLKGSLGFFTPLDVEGIPEPPPLPGTQKPDDKKAPAPAAPPAGRFAFLPASLPRSILDAVGETAGVIERDEIILTDHKTGRNWVLETRTETVKKEARNVKVTRNIFTRVFNSDELIVVREEKKDEPKDDSGYKLSKTLAEWRELFLEHRADKSAPAADLKPNVDCVVVLSKDGNVLPLVVLRRTLRDTRAVAVTPWQMELYSDKAVDYLCEQPSVEFEKADRYLIFINLAGRTAKGFNGLQARSINAIPDSDKLGKVIRAQ